MRVTHRILICLLGVSVVLSSPCFSQEPITVDHQSDVATLYWTTEDAVDRLDIQHLGASIRRLNESSEARAIAVWRYVRETMFHYPMRNENHADQFDAAKLINVYGYSFCTQQAVTAAAIGQAVGLPARVISVPGHGMYELFYDDQWHAFCTTAGFFVRTRHADGHIASMKELQADATLVTHAKEEGRSSVPFLPCAGGPELLGQPEGTEEVPYALSYRHYDEAFFAEAARDWHDMGPPNDSQYQAWTHLRRGESIRLDWNCSPHFQPPIIDVSFHPPRHLCGEKDRANPFFDEIASYARRFAGTTTYRYFGSGEHIWRPVLRSSQDLSDWTRAENILVEDGMLRSRNREVDGSAELEISGPYLFVTGMFSGVSTVRHGALKVLIQRADADAAWQPLYTAPRGESRFDIPLGNVLPQVPDEPARRREFTPYRFRLRVEFSGDALLSNCVVRSTIQHNWLALPRLHSGVNVVEVRTPVAKLPSGLELELAWNDQDGVQTFRQPLRMSPSRLRLNVQSAAIPRMRHVVLSRMR